MNAALPRHRPVLELSIIKVEADNTFRSRNAGSFSSAQDDVEDYEHQHLLHRMWGDLELIVHKRASSTRSPELDAALKKELDQLICLRYEVTRIYTTNRQRKKARRDGSFMPIRKPCVPQWD